MCRCVRGLAGAQYAASGLKHTCAMFVLLDQSCRHFLSGKLSFPATPHTGASAPLFFIQQQKNNSKTSNRETLGKNRGYTKVWFVAHEAVGHSCSNYRSVGLQICLKHFCSRNFNFGRETQSHQHQHQHLKLKTLSNCVIFFVENCQPQKRSH